jgi:hypothetical protein
VACRDVHDGARQRRDAESSSCNYKPRSVSTAARDLHSCDVTGVQLFIDPVHGAADTRFVVPEFPKCRRHAAVVRHTTLVQIESAASRGVEHRWPQDGRSQRQAQVGTEISDPLTRGRGVDVFNFDQRDARTGEKCPPFEPVRRLACPRRERNRATSPRVVSAA